MDKHFVVGKPVERIDAYDKVTGKAVYVGDMKFDRLLQGKILRSPYAHAIVKSIDTSKAKALPGARLRPRQSARPSSSPLVSE